MAAVLNLSFFAQRHKAIAGSAFTVACGAEAGNIIHLHQPVHDLVKGTPINDIELLGFCILRLWFAVAADTCFGTAANLGDTKMKYPLSCFLAFSCRNDHAGVRYGDSDTGNDFCECIVVDSVGKCTCIDIVCVAQSWNADRVRTYTEGSF